MTHNRWLWIAAFTGPLAWFLDLVASWMATPGAYRHEPSLSIHVISVVSILATLAAGIYAFRHRREGFVAQCAMFLAAFSLLVILGMAVPKWILPPGAEP
jgi:putative flippase GtrA